MYSTAGHRTVRQATNHNKQHRIQQKLKNKLLNYSTCKSLRKKLTKYEHLYQYQIMAAKVKEFNAFCTYVYILI
jgi:hypothetical protein